MNLIFLDIDGVLNTALSLSNHNEWNTDFHFDTQALFNLQQLILACNAKIIVSSSWRHCTPDSMCTKILHSNFTLMGIDAAWIDTTGTCSSTLPGEKRSNEILKYIIEHQSTIEHFIIIDDIVMEPFLSSHQYLCNVIEGFRSSSAVEQALHILQQPLNKSFLQKIYNERHLQDV